MEVTVRFATGDEEKVIEAMRAAHAVAPVVQARLGGAPCDVAVLEPVAKPKKAAKKKAAAK